MDEAQDPEIGVTHDPEAWILIPATFPDGPFRNAAAWAHTMAEVFGTNRRERKQLRAYAQVLGDLGPRIGLLARYWHRPGPDTPRFAAVNVFPVAVLEADVSLEEIARASGPDAMDGVTSDRIDIAGTSAVRAIGLLHDDEGRTQHALRIALGVLGWRVMIESYSYDDNAFTDAFMADVIALGNGVGVR